MIAYSRELAETVTALKAAGADAAISSALLTEINGLVASATKKLAALEAVTNETAGLEDLDQKAAAFRDKVFTAQVDLRKDIDALEGLLPSDLWPVPTYQEMLFDF